MRPSSSAGMPTKTERSRPVLAPGQDLLVEAIVEKQVKWDNDFAARPHVGRVRQDALALGARAVAVLPFLCDNTVQAIMVLYADADDTFRDDDVRLLRDLAGDVSFALDHIAKTRKVNYLATHDQLTGLPNRTAFSDRLEQRVTAARDDNKVFSLLVLDVERFQNVIETLGRQAGDDLLRQVAGRLQHALGATFSHTGGDRFVIATRRTNDVGGPCALR